MERLVIVGYKPFPGKESELKELMLTHWLTLKGEDLVSDRKPVLMQTGDGTIIEVFGWRSSEAIEAAHANPVVQEMWGKYAEVCEYIPVGRVAESANLFSEFAPLE